MGRRTIPSLNWLRVFEAAARLGSFAAAGQALNMSASAVSQQIKALETHLRTELFTRGPKNIRLTDAGTHFVPTVQRALGSIEETADALFRGATQSSLDVQVSLVFANAWLIPRLRHFHRCHPDTMVNISGGYRDADIDLAGPELYISFGGAQRSWGIAEPLMPERIYPIARASLSAELQAPEDIFAHPLIDVPEHQINWAYVLAQHRLHAPRGLRFVHVDSTEIALTMAAHGCGIALARAPVSDSLMQLHGLAPCPGFQPIQGSECYYLMYRAKHALSPAAERFRDWLLREVALERPS